MMLFLRLLFAAAAFAATAAQAQPAFPSKPVHIVVPFPAGGAADLLARSLGEALSESWGQHVVVDNRPGASSMLATHQVQRAPPDGYTLLMVAPSFLMNPMLTPEARYDPLRDFTPVALLVTSPVVLAVPPSSSAHTLRELIDYARAHPGRSSFAAVGPGTLQQMIGEMLEIEAKIDWVYAPFPGGAPAVTAALGSHVDAVIANYSEVSAFISAGKLRPLAVGTRQRIEALRDVPTLHELGYSLVDGTIWFGLVAPAHMPREIAERIHADIQRALQRPAVREKLLTQSLYPAAEPLGPFLAAQAPRYEHVIKQASLGRR